MRAAKMAELKKRVGSLKRELEVAQDMKPAELAGLRRTFISQDIVTATSQIEKIVLASQLARLSVQGQRQPSPADGTADATEPSQASLPRAVHDGQGATTEDQPGAAAVDNGAAKDKKSHATRAVGDAGKTSHHRTSLAHGAAAHAAHLPHRQGASFTADVVSNTYHEAGQKARQVDVQA